MSGVLPTCCLYTYTFTNSSESLLTQAKCPFKFNVNSSRHYVKQLFLQKFRLIHCKRYAIQYILIYIVNVLIFYKIKILIVIYFPSASGVQDTSVFVSVFPYVSTTELHTFFTKLRVKLVISSKILGSQGSEL